MNTLYADRTVESLAATWNEAKLNETGWITIRRETEEALIEHYKAEFEKIVAGLDTTLTTTVMLGDLLKVTVGKELKVDQVEVLGFLDRHQAMLGVLFKPEFKAITPSVMSKVRMNDALSKDLQKVVSLKEKKPSFAAK